VALNLFHAFLEAKERLIAPARDLVQSYFQFGYLSLQDRNSLPVDPFPFGITSNQKTLGTMARYGYEQNLTKRLVGLEEIFSPNTMDS
jgi:hypothetical protein